MGTPPATITVQGSLVLVPALVKTHSGELVFSLTADDFLLTDDGVPQKLRLEPDTDAQPLALVVLVEIGGAGAGRLGDYRELDAMLDALIGNVPHKVAVVGFDSEPTLLRGFTENTDAVVTALNRLEPGDEGRSLAGRAGLCGQPAAPAADHVPARHPDAERNGGQRQQDQL